MHAILFHAFGYAVRSDSSMIFLAALFGLVVGPWWARALEGIPPRVTFKVHLLLGLAALAGGRLHYAINYPFLAAGRLPWQGIHAGGAIIGMIVAAPAIFAYYRLHPGRMADAIMPATGIGIAIARMGCFLNGCCFGVQCAYPWCLSFPPGSPAGVFEAEHKLVDYTAWSLPVHPLQLYFVATGLAITAVALWLIPRKRYHGQVALVGLLLFASGAYLLEPFRQDAGFRLYVGDVPQLQIVAWWLVETAVGGLVVCEMGHRLLARRAQARALAS